MFIPTHEIPEGIFFIVVLFFPVQIFYKNGGNVVGIWWESRNCGGKFMIKYSLINKKTFLSQNKILIK